jgi:site-specific DNA recombinase
LKIVVRWDEVERYLAWQGTGIYKKEEAAWPHMTKMHLLDVPCSTLCSARKLCMPIEPKPNRNCHWDSRLIRLVHEARRAQSLVDENRTAEVSELAKQMQVSPWRFARYLHINYLAPDILTALLDGTQPRGLTRKQVLDANLPLDWALQRRILGFPPRASSDGF